MPRTKPEGSAVFRPASLNSGREGEPGPKGGLCPLHGPWYAGVGERTPRSSLPWGVRLWWVNKPGFKSRILFILRLK